MLIHGEKLRWLFWLRWKLFQRGFTRDRSRIIGAIFMIIFGLPLYAAIAVGTFLAYRYLPYPANAEVLFLVLTTVYLLWMVLPLLEFTVNEGLDVSKLLPFPLTRWELMAGLLFSTLLDIPMFGLLLVFIAVVAGWAFSLPLALFAVVAILIFYVQVVGMSQLVLAILMRTLQSRRFRDLSIILIALFSSSCYILQQVVFRTIGNGNIVENLQRGTYSSYLQWLPPGMTARAISLAAIGDWGISLAWLAGSLLASVVVLYLWSVVLERSLSTPEVGGAVRARHRRTVPGTKIRRATTRMLTPGLSAQILAITVKELKYFWRDPQLKAMLLGSLYIIVVLFIGPFFNSGSSSRFGWETLTFTVPLAVYYTVFTFSYNTLGMERQSLTTLFLFPVEPRRILFGKNLAVALLGIVELIVLIVVSAIISRNWGSILPVLVIGLAGIGVVLGCGNFSSIFIPQRMRQLQRGIQASGQSSGSAGCIRAVMSLGLMLVTVVLLVPVAVALFLPVFFHIQWVWILSIPLAILYAGAFYLVVTWLVAPQMLRRAPEILAITTRE